jgi:hypothetical protein
MIAILGLLGIFQSVYLPGAICFNFFRIKTTLIIYLITVFSLSFAINSNLVFLLCYFKIYNQIAILTIFLFEILLFIYIKKINKKNILTDFCLNKDNKFNFENINIFSIKYNKIIKLIHIILYCMLFSIIVGRNGLANLGNVFLNADAVMSWNRWAVELATLGAPIDPRMYPQLLPSVISIPYVFMNDSWIQFFSFAICLIFPSWAILVCLTIFKKFPLSSFLSAITLYFWPIKKFNYYIGYVDLPITIFGFMVLAAVIWGYKESKIVRIKSFILASFFMGATCALKYAGFMLLLFFPLIIFDFKLLESIDKKLKFKLIILSFIIIAFFSLPWHIYNQIQILNGLTYDNTLDLVEQAHNNISFIQRIISVYDKYSVFYLLLVLIISCLFINKNKYITIFALSYSFIWLLLFSYDDRNFYLALPYISFSIGLSAQNLIYIYGKNFENINMIKRLPFFRYKYILSYLFAIIIVISLFYMIYNSNKIKSDLYKRQDRKVLFISNKKIDNTYVVNIFNNNPDAIIITNDYLIPFIVKGKKNNFIHYYPYNKFDYDIKNIQSIINNIGDKKIYIYFNEFVDKDFIYKLPSVFKPVFNAVGTFYLVNEKNN